MTQRLKGRTTLITGSTSNIGRAAAVAFAAEGAHVIASDDASFVHGAVLDVDGGRTEVAVIAG
jgi:short-subunit dehydrogenase involved in D-alanine esterification of teichoic acids